ncbi:MAG: aldo/keto reductase [Oscillospiraceae bacterium]|nr:aldo/keto reductase [Oscillospiraceae bacterium]
MRYRKLGKTGFSVSELGFGTIPILSGSVPVLPEYFSPDTVTAVNIMKRAFALGCNFFDTAVPEEYGDAEYKLGIFARDIGEKYGRNKIIISDKARYYDGGDMYNAVIKSRENLGTLPDIYFVHQVDSENMDRVFGKYGALDALCDLKAEGKIGYTGIASHYYDVLLRGAKDPRVDVLQGSGNIFERGMLDRIKGEESFSEKGVILNKVYAAGVLIGVFDVEELIGGILNYPFSSALIGMGTFEQVDAALGHEITPRSYSFEQVIKRVRTKFEPIPCTRCQRCKCPHGTEIHTMFRQYNYYFLGKNFWALKKLELNIKHACECCLQCETRVCEADCPMRLHIPELIEMVGRLAARHINFE